MFDLKQLLPLLLVLLFCQRAAFSQITTDGRYIYTQAGEKLVLRGVNKMNIWTDVDGSNSFPEIKKTGANSVRIVWLTTGTPYQLASVLRNSIINDMVPVIELHDATGEWSQFNSLVDYWVSPEIVSVINDHQAYTILNIANEPDAGISDEQWRDGYMTAITRIRNAGITVPLMIDGTDYSKKYEPIRRYGKELINHDPLNRIIFSVHAWWPEEWGFTPQDITDTISDAVSQNIPFVFGEFAHTAVDCLGVIDYKRLIRESQQNEIGWLAWSWGPGNTDCAAMDMTEDNNYNTLHDWGLEVAVTDQYSIANTSITPNSIVNMTPGPLPPAPYTFTNNVAKNKPVTVSSVENTNYAGDLAVDENIASRWSSSSSDGQPTITIDLEASYDINEIILHWEAAYATQYRVEISENNSTWTELLNVNNGQGGIVIESVSGTGRYVRVVGTSRVNSSWGISLYEVVVKSASDGSSSSGGGNCAGVNVYPNWTAKDWPGGEYNHANAGDQMVYQNNLYQANWYTNSVPGSDDSWTSLGACN